MGWIPDLPDPRDYTFRHKAVRSLLKRLKPFQRNSLPDEVDLRGDDEGEYFTAPEDQGPVQCSAAFSTLSLVEYFERRIRGRVFEGSKRFLYKVTRNLRQKSSVGENCRGLQASANIGEQNRYSHSFGDTGADLRTTLKVLTSIGVPPEEFWPYDIDRFDEEPSQFAYRLAKPLSGVRYFRLDEPNCVGSETWLTVASFLAAGFPVVFGFPVPASLTADANIPFRADLDTIRGGHAVVAVGYKYHHFGRGQHALLIRSSWGRQWGDNGNGWLPVAFLQKQLARDFWSLVGDDWLDSAELSKPCLIQFQKNSIDTR